MLSLSIHHHSTQKNLFIPTFFFPVLVIEDGKRSSKATSPCPSLLLWPLHSPLCLLALPFPAFNSVPTFSLTLGLTFSFPFWSPNGSFSCFSPPQVLFYLVPPFPPWIMHSGILYDSRLPSAAWRFTSVVGLGTFPLFR